MGKGMHWLRRTPAGDKPGGAPASAVPSFGPPVKRMLLTAGGPVTSPSEPEDARSFRLLSEAWGPVLAWRDASPPLCLCRRDTAPMVEAWLAYQAAPDLSPEALTAQWDGLKATIAVQQRAAAREDGPARPANIAGAPVDLEAEIAEACDVAGANDLPPGPAAWFWGRVGAHGLDVSRWNLGRLRSSSIGCACAGADGLASFPSIAEGAERLVDVARRAGATPKDPAPDLLEVGDLDEAGRWHTYWKRGLYFDRQGRARNGWHVHPSATPAAVAGVYTSAEAPPVEQLEVGWILGFGPDEAAQKLYEQLRADWASFQAAGVGTGKFAFLAPDVEAWNRFSTAWERSDATLASFPFIQYQSADLGPPAELGARLNAQVATANRVRAEIATQATGTPTAPGDLDATRKGLEDAPGASWAGKRAEAVETWAKDVPILSSLTDPKQAPGVAGKRILFAGAALAAALLAGVVYVMKPAAPRVYVNTRASR